mgnify:CR=1 FL=1
MNKAHTKKAAWPFIDYDYWRKLSKEERAWLQKFNNEYYLNSVDKNPLHKKAKMRERYSADNERRRDGWNVWERLDYDPDWVARNSENDNENQ